MRGKKIIVLGMAVTLLTSLVYGCSGRVKVSDDKNAVMETKSQQSKYLWIEDKNYGYIMSYSLSNNTAVTDGLYLAYSKDGKTFTALNHNAAVYYTKVGTGRMDAPSIFRKTDNTFGIVAADNGMNKNVILMDSTDLITFDNQRVAEVSNSGNVLRPKCMYDDASKSYNLYWHVGNKIYSSSSKNLESFNPPQKVSESFIDFEGVMAPENAVIGGIVGVSQEEYDKILKAYNLEVTLDINAKKYPSPLVEERADPWILLGEDGYYYFTGSYPMTGDNDAEGYSRVVLRRSKTIEGLAQAEEKVIWNEAEEDSVHRFIWAPELHNINGSWYVYFAGAVNRSNVYSVVPQVLRCKGTDPYEDPWEYVGRFQGMTGDTFSFNGFSLDMTYFENAGKHYVIWAQKPNTSNLYMAEINPKEPWKLISNPIMLTKPEYSWEKQVFEVNEGAAVLKQNNKIYVSFSASGTGSEYCVGLLWADADSDLMNIDSWTKEVSPILTTEDLDGESGPGHNSFTVDEDGNLLLIYHARPASHEEGKCGTFSRNSLVDPCRHARVKRVYFTADGKMVLRAK